MFSDQSEKLDKLFKDGKISQEEYQEFKKNLPGREPLFTPSEYHFTGITRPLLIWIIVGLFVLVGLVHVGFCIEFFYREVYTGMFYKLNIANIAHHKSFRFFVAAVLELFIAGGLFYGLRWVYLFTLGSAFLACIATLFAGKFHFASLVVNTVFFVLILFAWKYFYKTPYWAKDLIQSNK